MTSILIEREVLLKRREEESVIVPKDVILSSKKWVGAAYAKNSQAIHTGLTLEEERFYLPFLLEVDPKDIAFRSKTKDFWLDLRILATFLGTPLDISVYGDENGKELLYVREETTGEPVIAEKGQTGFPMPRNVKEYVTYKWLSTHPKVAKDETEWKGDPHKEYILEHKEDVIRGEFEKAQLAKDAYKVFIDLTSNPSDTSRMDWVLKASGYDIYDLSAPERENLLHEYVKNKPKEVIRVAADDKLKVKAAIIDMVNKNIISKQGPTYLFTDTVLGNNLDEVVRWMEDEANSASVGIMKARYKDSIRTNQLVSA